MALVITSLMGYLEWGGTSHGFLFEIEAEVLRKLFSDPFSAIHPLTLIPLAGQFILLFTLFQKKPSRVWSYIGLGSLSILLLLIFFIGVISLNIRIAGSVIPFLVVTILLVRSFKKS